jgi:hypothetical protein
MTGVVVAGCAIVPVSVRDYHSGKLLNDSDGSPVGGARVTVRSWGLMMPGALRKGVEVETETSTLTDTDGRWTVPSRYDLKFAFYLPEGSPNFGDELIFDAPDGRRVVIPEARRRGSSDAPSGLRAMVDEHKPRPPRAVTTAGVLLGGAEAASAYFGGLLFPRR